MSYMAQMQKLYEQAVSGMNDYALKLEALDGAVIEPITKMRILTEKSDELPEGVGLQKVLSTAV